MSRIIVRSETFQTTLVYSERAASDAREETIDQEFSDLGEDGKLHEIPFTDKVIQRNVEGRRIVDIGFLWQEIAKKFVSHRCPVRLFIQCLSDYSKGNSFFFNLCIRIITT